MHGFDYLITIALFTRAKFFASGAKIPGKEVQDRK
jgi:hypothetical protein